MTKQTALKIALIVGLAIGTLHFSPLSFASAPAMEAKNVLVRIAVLKETPTLTLDLKSPYAMSDPASYTQLKSGRRLRGVRFKAVPGGIEVEGEFYPLKKIRVTARDNVALLGEAKPRLYRGAIDVVLNSNNTLTAINVVDIEQYVQGVLYHEVSHRWPQDALMTQAVATRSYAVYQIQQRRAHEYDVTSDIYSQVYGGKNAERYRTNIAVSKTAGEVLVFQGKILPAYFHATCAGHTEDARELWNHDELYPLKGVRCLFCTDSPHYNWERNFRLKDIQDKLNAAGRDIDLIQDIQVLSRNASHRIKELEITSRTGKQLTISGKDFRNIVGPNLLRSNNYEVVMKGYYCDLVGHGWGHGVGMCQWGARKMSQERYDYRQILEYYYPGSQIVDYRKMNLAP